MQPTNQTEHAELDAIDISTQDPLADLDSFVFNEIDIDIEGN